MRPECAADSEALSCSSILYEEVNTCDQASQERDPDTQVGIVGKDPAGMTQA